MGTTRKGLTKLVKNIPESENGRGVVCITKQKQKYRISQNREKGKHTLWKVVDGGFEKMVSGDSPYDLYPLIDWDN